MREHPIVKRVNKLKEAHALRLEKFATARLVEWHRTFRRKYPRLRGFLQFGMGTCGIWIGRNRSIFVMSWDMEHGGKYYRSLGSLGEAMRDVEDICDQYMSATPPDFTF